MGKTAVISFWCSLDNHSHKNLGMLSLRISARLVISFTLVFALNSCAEFMQSRQLSKYQSYDLPALAPNDRSKVKVKVKVSVKKQRVYVLEGDRMLLAMPVSVGEATKPTPLGSYKIFRKRHMHRANSHGFGMNNGKVRRTYLRDLNRGETFKGTPMPYWCEFKQHYGFHTGWVKHRPCTHGCIRMHENLAPKFFDLVSEGTPVYIAQTQPEDATHGNLPLPPDAGPLPDYPSSMYWGDGYFSQHKRPTFVSAIEE